MSWQSLHPERRALYQQILTPLQYDALRHRINGHEWRTIARAMNKDESTIRGHYKRALERIRKHLEAAA